MKHYSIDFETSKINPYQSKVYYYFYADSGFELGFGKAGTYSGHSHLFFCDIIFSNSKISTSNANGENLIGRLILVPSRTFLGNVITDDFFFLKFCSRPDNVLLPDKTEEILTIGVIEVFNENILKKIPWFETNTSEESSVIIDLQNEKLHIRIGETDFIIDK